MADKSIEYHDLLSGFVRVHILHHAAEREIYGQWVMDELARHGYRLSPGTVYPMLRAMEARGYLSSREEAQGAGRPRRIYVATTAGRKALAVAEKRLRELVGEVAPRRV
jgi:PadR family transcriptional regulator, regulatory protein PadR